MSCMPHIYNVPSIGKMSLTLPELADSSAITGLCCSPCMRMNTAVQWNQYTIEVIVHIAQTAHTIHPNKILLMSFI